MQNNATYISQLTILRFVAALWVVIFHYGQQTWPFQLPLLRELASEGSVAVSFFFFLSGLVLTVSYGTQANISYKNFLIKRGARIYPVYLLLFGITLLTSMLAYHAYPKGLSIIMQALGLHAWVPGICLEINFPAWSISVEMFFYLLFPALLLLYKKMKFSHIAIHTILFWFICGYLHYYLKHLPLDHSKPETGQFILYFPPWHLNTFLFGMLAGWYISISKSPTNTKVWLWRIGYTAGTILFILTLATENPIRPLVHNGLLSPLFFLICVGLSIDSSWFTKILGTRPLVWLGNVSYSVYLAQFPVYIAYTQITQRVDVSGNHFFVYLAALITASGILYTLIEKPARHHIIKKWA